MTALPNPRVSPSQLGAFAGPWGCEKAWAYRYIEKHKEPTSGRMFIGTSWDEALTAAHREKLGGHTPPADLIADVFLDTWRNPPTDNRNGEPNDYDLSDAPTDIETRAIAAARDYQTNVLPGINPVDVQAFRSVMLDPTGVELVGYIDLVESAATIGLPGTITVDQKASLSARKQWTTTAAAADPQLRIYDLLQRAHGVDVAARGWRGARLTGAKTTHTLQEAFVVSRPEDDEQTLDLVGGILGRMEDVCRTGDFLPTAAINQSFKCSHRLCAHYAKTCPNGARGRVAVAITKDVSEEAA